ncbi:MAG: acyltransferase [Clostridiales Family XIII bacterium]|jgi:peptidoglycan/LPS O-acetylase OafA/YrhL|nr:acyltransferase [Clostridiales Family XIII bacterium]
MTTTKDTRTLPQQRLADLDLMRSAAVVAVVAIHVYAHAYAAPDIILAGGRVGLSALSAQLFFAVSGAALSYTSPPDRPFPIGTYWKKRVWSVYIIFWIAYLFWTVFQGVRAGGFGDAQGWRYLFSVFGVDGLLQSIGIQTYYKIGEWFLGPLLFLYAIFPALRKIGMRAPSLLAAVVAVIVCAGYALTADGNVRFFLLMPLASFTFGILLRHLPVNAPGAAICAAIAAVCVATAPAGSQTGDTAAPRVVLFGLAAVYLFSFVGRRIRGRAATRFLAWFSGLSFAIILMHHPIIGDFIYLWFNPAGSPASVFIPYLLLLAAVILGASLLLKLAERGVKAAILKISGRNGRRSAS